MNTLFNLESSLRRTLTVMGLFVSLLVIRMLAGYEFYEAGMEKYNGENWFGSVTFPFPFSLLPLELNWALATWFEVLGGIALMLGLATRYISFSLIILTVVAIYAAHMPESLQTIDGERVWAITGIGSISEFFDGYRISEQCANGYCTGNYKLPVMYILMFIPLVFSGAGKLSLDHLLVRLRGES